MSLRNEVSDKMSETLLLFLDFLYAVVFGLILEETFTSIINDEKAEYNWFDKCWRAALVIGVFYVIAWDWLHARLLTIKHPYKSYRRFFYDVGISCVAYGGALDSVQSETSFLIYMSLLLFGGVIWAQRVKTEYPNSNDRDELNTIMVLQTIYACIALMFYFMWRVYVGRTVTLPLVVVLAVQSWFMVIVYELNIPRSRGLLAGPGVPFLSRRFIVRLRIGLIRTFRHRFGVNR